MRRSIVAAGLLLVACTSGALAAGRHGRHRGHLPVPVGTCLRTRVVEARLGPDASALLRYSNGIVQISDAQGVTETRPGDPIKLCLVARTQECGDDAAPGRTFAAGNLRTGAAWTSADARMGCPAS